MKSRNHPPSPTRPPLDSPAAAGSVRPAYYVYILRCADGTLYTGFTNDLAARELTHNSGRGAKYTRSRRPVQVVYAEPHDSRSAAQKREAQLKAWTRAEKQALIAGGAAPRTAEPPSWS